MYISELMILSAQSTLLSRAMRHDIKFKASEKFLERLHDSREDGIGLLPHFEVEAVKFFHIFRNELYFVGVTTAAHIAPIHVIDILKRFYTLLKDFLGAVNEETIRANTTLIYEVLDEFMDHGYVQLSTTDKIKPYILSTPAQLRDNSLRPAAGLFGLEYHTAPGNAADKPILHSRVDQDQRSTEIYVNVVERLGVLVAANGSVLRSELRGEVTMKCFLHSSAPLVKLGLNRDLVLSTSDDNIQGYGGTVHLDRCVFHNCVELGAEFDEARILKIRPPEGEFALMTYQIEGQLSRGLPFRLYTAIRDNVSDRDLEFSVKLVCDAPANCKAINVIVRIPVPKSTTSISQQLSYDGGQTATLDSSLKRIEWNIKSMQSKLEHSATFKLIDAKSRSRSCVDELGPIALDFELSNYLCSGLQLLHLRVIDQQRSSSGAAAQQQQSMLRYITVADSYVFKIV